MMTIKAGTDIRHESLGIGELANLRIGGFADQGYFD